MPVLSKRRVQPSLSIGFFNYIVKQQIPVVASQTLIIAEIIRKIPVDFRMGARAKARGRVNVSEMLYFAIKAFALVAVLLDCIIQESTALATPSACHAASSASIFLWYSSSTLVAAALAWRTYVIFGRHPMAGRLLVVGLCMQFAATLAAVVKTHKFLGVTDGYCDYIRSQILELHKGWRFLASPWFIFINFLFDMSVVTASTWKLISSSRGPLGFSGLARVLISNGVQYAVVVCTVNFIEFILIATMYEKIPSLLSLTITIQIITGLNLIAEEQDAVHGYTRAQPSRRGYSYGTDGKATASPAPNRALLTRDTGSITAYGTVTNGHGELSKEAYQSMMSADDQGVIKMHTCVDVEVDSDRSDKTVQETSGTQYFQAPASQPPLPLFVQEEKQPQQQQSGPSVSWEITMGSPVRRKPISQYGSNGALSRAASSGSSPVQHAPSTLSAAGEHLVNHASLDLARHAAAHPARDAPAAAAAAAYMSLPSSAGGAGSSRAVSPVPGGPRNLLINSSSSNSNSTAAASGSGAPVTATAPPLTPHGGVSIRSIRQAMGSTYRPGTDAGVDRPESVRSEYLGPHDFGEPAHSPSGSS